MSKESQSNSQKLAVLIDADNAIADVIEPLLKEVAKYGTAHVKRIYGDWTNPNLNRWKSKLIDFAIQPIQQFSYTSGKNSTDSALIIDAMDLLYTQRIDGFCIVSSDSDFTRLVSRIRESGLLVYGFGEKKTPPSLISACDKFVYIEILGRSEDSTPIYALKDASDAKSEGVLKDATGITTLAIDTQKLKDKKELASLLEDAYETVAEEDGWANLGPFGAQLTKLSPSFDQRNYGYKKLGDLIRATDLFELKEVPHDKNPAVKWIYIKFKS